MRPQLASFVDLVAEMLAKIVTARLIAHEEQPIGQHANPLAITAEDVVVRVERGHTATLDNQMPCRALGARRFSALHMYLSENASQEFHDVSDFETRRAPVCRGMRVG